MSVCPVCGYLMLMPGPMCSYHVAMGGRDWATGNRIMCDFVHRGIVRRAAEDVDLPRAA